MDVIETIHEKVAHLPLPAQEEVLEAVEQIEGRYLTSGDQNDRANGGIEALFGSISLGFATGTDNEKIDEDLVREYNDTHDEG